MLDSAADVLAYIVGRNADVLAWNRLTAALITDFGALQFLATWALRPLYDTQGA